VAAGVQERERARAIGRVLVALAALVLHDVPLHVESLLGERIDHEAHAVALEPEQRLQVLAGHGLEVVGAIPARRAIAVGDTDGLQDVIELVAHVLRALEHQVLE